MNVVFEEYDIAQQNYSGSRSIVCGNINAPEKSIIGPMPNVAVLAYGRWLDRRDDEITYSY